MNSEHQKHAKLSRPALGEFGRLEWAITGAPCDTIKALAASLVEQLSPFCQVAYIDADHKEDLYIDIKNKYNIISKGAAFNLVDKINYAQIELAVMPNAYQHRTLMNACDIVLVNGNHFTAQRQILIIDPRKEQSLQKKLDRLSSVDLIVLTENGRAAYPFLSAHLGEQADRIPEKEIADLPGIAAFIKEKWEQSKPPLYGLVLAGGKSLRMGEDKGSIVYHQKTQRQHVAELLQPHCEQVFVSCRPDQAEQFEKELPYPVLADTFAELGPLGAILSAFRRHPDAAWLVLACDLPLLNEHVLSELIAARAPGKMATAFQQPDTADWPEPLVAIWEPKCYLSALQFLAQGHSCPRKILINNDIRLITCSQPGALKNVNTRQEKDEITDLLEMG